MRRNSLALSQSLWHGSLMGFFNDIYLSRKPLAGFVVIGLAWASYFAQMPVIKGELGASDGLYGALVLIAALGALAAMWLAPLTDRYAGPFSLPVGALLVACGFVWAGASPGIVGFALAMTLASAGSGIVDVLVNARLAGIEARSGRNLMNLNHGLYSFAYAGAAVLTGAAREAHWTPSHVFGLLFVVILALCFVMYGRDTEGAHEDANRRGPTDVPTGLIWIIGLIVLIAFLSEAATEGWSALHIERTLGGGAGEGALGPALMGLTMGFGRLSGHALARFISDRVLIAVALLLSAAGLWIAAGAQSLLAAYCGFALAGLGISVVAPLSLGFIGRMVPARARLYVISRASVIGYSAYFVGPPLMGFVSEGFGLRMSFYVIVALLVCVAVTLAPQLGRFRRPT